MSFNAEEFMQAQTEESTSTEYVPVPEGEFNAVIHEVKGREANGNPIMDVTWKIDAPGNEEANEKQARQSIFLDISDGGALLSGKGQNVQLGRLRDAVGQNTPGQPWAPSMLEGQVAVITIKHSFGDEGQIYSNVKGTAKLG